MSFDLRLQFRPAVGADSLVGVELRPALGAVDHARHGGQLRGLRLYGLAAQLFVDLDAVHGSILNLRSI